MKHTAERNEIYNFNHYSVSEVLATAKGNSLLNGQVDGMVVEGFLSPQEVDSILNGFLNLTPQQLININKGFISYPISFAQYTQGLMSNTVTPQYYHTHASAFRAGFADMFGVNIEQKLIHFFEQAFKGKKVNIPHDKEGYGSFMPFNFRNLLPEYGELKVHCENLFFNEFPLFFELMSHLVIRKNDFSFFVVLQQPEAGGELCLYDARWAEEAHNNFAMVGDTNNYVLKLQEQELKQQSINPPVGSLVLFSGGDIWHKVDIVKGNKSRITLGGFISSGLDDNNMFFWA